MATFSTQLSEPPVPTKGEFTLQIETADSAHRRDSKLSATPLRISRISAIEICNALSAR